MTKVKCVAALSVFVLLSGCLSLGTRIGIGSDGVRGGVVLNGATEVANGVTVGTSLGKAF